MSDALTLEYLSTPAPERRRAPFVIGGAVALLAVVVGGFLWWSDSVRVTANEQLAVAYSDSVAGAAAVSDMVAQALRRAAAATPARRRTDMDPPGQAGGWRHPQAPGCR